MIPDELLGKIASFLLPAILIAGFIKYKYEKWKHERDPVMRKRREQAEAEASRRPRWGPDR